MAVTLRSFGRRLEPSTGDCAAMARRKRNGPLVPWREFMRAWPRIMQDPAAIETHLLVLRERLPRAHVLFSEQD